MSNENSENDRRIAPGLGRAGLKMPTVPSGATAQVADRLPFRRRRIAEPGVPVRLDAPIVGEIDQAPSGVVKTRILRARNIAAMETPAGVECAFLIGGGRGDAGCHARDRQQHEQSKFSGNDGMQ